VGQQESWTCEDIVSFLLEKGANINETIGKWSAMIKDEALYMVAFLFWCPTLWKMFFYELCELAAVCAETRRVLSMAKQ
jgi:hypothetical protein